MVANGTGAQKTVDLSIRFNGFKKFACAVQDENRKSVVSSQGKQIFVDNGLNFILVALLAFNLKETCLGRFFIFKRRDKYDIFFFVQLPQQPLVVSGILDHHPYPMILFDFQTHCITLLSFTPALAP